MKRLLHTPLTLLLRRIVLLYAVLMLCRVVFYLYNAQLLGTIGRGELWQLLAGSLKFDTVSVIYANGVFILLALLPLHVRERGWYRKLMYWYYVAVNAVLVVAVNMSDCVYFRYTQKRFTADEVFFADNSNSVQLVGKFMAENWYLVLVAAALVALLAWGYGRKVREESLLSRGWAYYVGSTVIFATGAGLSIAGMRGGMTRMTRPITLSNATLYTDDSGKANLILSNPFCILRTIGNAGSINYKKYFTPEELPQHFTPVHQPADSAAVNLAGRNVMVFIMESMSAEHSAYLMPEVYAGRETKGFTPFLDSLMRGGLCFKRMYANGTRSIQAMPSVLGSIPSFRTPFVLMPQSLGESRQLPAILRGRGYSTAFFCGSEHGSMGFGAYARSAGVERLVSREDYEDRHGKGDFDGYWGIWDEPFLQFTGEELSRTPEPFFATLFTLSSHHPFVVPAQYEDKLPAGYTKLHKGVAYVDNALLRALRKRRMVPPHDIRIRSRPCVLRKIRRQNPQLSGQLPYHRLHVYPRRRLAGPGRRGRAAARHHAHAPGAAGQYGVLFRIRPRRAERTAATAVVGELGRGVPGRDERRHDPLRRRAGQTGSVGRRGFPPAGFPRPCPAILFPRRKKELHRP